MKQTTRTPSVAENIARYLQKVRAAEVNWDSDRSFTIWFKMDYTKAKDEFLAIAEQYHAEKTCANGGNTLRRRLFSRARDCYLGICTRHWYKEAKKMGRFLPYGKR